MNKTDFEALCLRYQNICHQKKDIEDKILEEMTRRFSSGDWNEADELNVLGTIIDFGRDWNRDNFPFDQFLMWFDKMK